MNAKKCGQKFLLSMVESIHGRFQDSVESIKNRVKFFLDSSQGEISMCLFDSVPRGKKTSWDKIMWAGKDYEEAITFAEVSIIKV